MEAEAFENWKLCWEINTYFHNGIYNSGEAKCPWCQNVRKVSSKSTSFSQFGNLASFCSWKHDIQNGIQLAVCPECEVDLVQKITERKQKCWEEGCERYMNVNRDVVMKTAGNGKITQKYLSLVQTHQNFQCQYCCEEIPLDEGPSRSPTRQCQHDPVYCSDCLTAYISEKIMSGEWKSIKCPEPHCTCIIGGQDVLEFCLQETFLIYNEHITRENLSKNPNFRWCVLNCGNGQILKLPEALSHSNTIELDEDPDKFELFEDSDIQLLRPARNHFGESEDGLIDVTMIEENNYSTTEPGIDSDMRIDWRCNKCETLNCSACQKEGHPGQTCEERRLLSPEEIDEKEKRRIAKRCPSKGCGRYIHKRQGCKHMLCEKKHGGCGNNFCWKCKIIFPKKETGWLWDLWDFVHFEGCPMVGGMLENQISKTIPRPLRTDPAYREDYDADPGYEEGNSDTEW